MDFSSRLGSSRTVTLSASDHVEAVTKGVRRGHKRYVRYMYMGCHTDGEI